MTLCAATTRRQHPASRDAVPGRDQRREHHQRLRQLHQGRCDHHNHQRSGHSDTPQGAGQRRGPHLQSQLLKLPAGTLTVQQADSSSSSSSSLHCGTCADCASQEASTPASAGTTPSHAATPISSFPTRESSQPTANGARPGSKKKKAGEDEDTDGPSVKRNKISYGRE